MLEMVKTDKRAQVLAILRGHDGWMDRTEIAAALGKKALNPSEKLLLERLADAGEIERDNQIVGITEKRVYRVRQ